MALSKADTDSGVENAPRLGRRFWLVLGLAGLTCLLWSYDPISAPPISRRGDSVHLTAREAPNPPSPAESVAIPTDAAPGVPSSPATQPAHVASPPVATPPEAPPVRPLFPSVSSLGVPAAPRPARSRLVSGPPVPSLQRKRRSPSALGAVGVAGVAGPDEPLLRLRSGLFELLPGAPVSIDGPSAHLIVQFHGPLTEADRIELERLGVELAGFVPNRAFLARVPRESLESLGDLRSVRAIGNLFPADKLPSGLASGTPSPHARHGEVLDVRLALHRGVELGRAVPELSALGVELHESPASVAGWLKASLPMGSVHRVASLDTVLYLEEAEPPRATTNVTGGDRGNVRAAAESPFNVDGTGVKVGIWDGGEVEATHPDFGGRVTNMEEGDVDGHATHVAGTIAGSGLGSARAKGQAPGAAILAYGFDGDPVLEMRHAADSLGIVISSNSWGHVIGWECPSGGSSESCSAAAHIDSGDHALFGLYSGFAQDWDQMVIDTEMSVTKSAGNDRNDGKSDSEHDGIKVEGDFYDTMEDQACAKNIITVGAVRDDESITEFTSWGPVDDGRVKPDLVANGQNLFSVAENGGYEIRSGTSMSTPLAAGQLALFYELHSNLGGGTPRSSRVKAIAINSTHDLQESPHANRGPDYSTGHGLLDVQRMLAVARAELTSPNTKMTLAGSFSSTGETTTATFTIEDARKELSFTLVWTDPRGSPVAGPALVNDLDLRLIGPDGKVWKPWSLDPANPTTPAIRANNFVDNVERVSLTRTEVTAANDWAGTWRLLIRAGSINDGPQNWDLASDVALANQPAGSAPTVTLSNPPASASGRPRIKATVTPSSGRTILAVQYRIDSSPWLAMVKNDSSGLYESLVDYSVTDVSTVELQVRAMDDAARVNVASRTLTQGDDDDHPNSAGSTGSDDTIIVGGAAAQGVIDPGGASPECCDFFRVNLTAGTAYTLEVIPADGFVPELTLFDTDGSTPLAQTTASADVPGSPSARIIGHAVATTDTYFVKIREWPVDSPALDRYEYSIAVFETGVFPRISASTTNGAADLSVTFTNHTAGEVTSYSWDFGDSTTSTVTTPTHSYTKPGVYSARVTAIATAGSVQSNAIEITVTGDDHPSTTGSTVDPDDTIIADGAVVRARFDLDGDVDFFRIPTNDGDNYVIDVIAPDEVNTELQFQDTDGGELETNVDPSPQWARSSALITGPLSGSGVRFIRVQGLFSGSGPKYYKLRVRSLTVVPNLKVTDISIPAAKPTSQLVDFTVTVSNPSSIAVTEAFTVALFSSNNSTIEFNDTFLREATLSGLASGATTVVKIPAFFGSTGSRNIWAVVDRGRLIPESDESDNSRLESSINPTSSGRPPRVDAGPERSVTINTSVALTASATDPDGDSITYDWTQLSGPASPAITNDDSASASVTLTATGRYRFLVTATDSDSRTATAPQDVFVFETTEADLDVLTVTAGTASVNKSQTNIGVTFTARNRGSRIAFVNIASLTFLQGATDVTSFYTVSPVSEGSSFLQTGTTATYSFLVNVSPSAPSGSTNIHGKLIGTDAETGSVVSTDTADAPFVWNVLAPAEFTLGTPTLPSTITRGQAFTVTVPVTNTGDNSASSISSSLGFSGSGLNVSPRSNPTSLAAGASGNFIFDITSEAGASTGSRTVSFSIDGTDDNSSGAINASDSSLATVTVQTAPQLSITGLSASRTLVSVGQVTTVTVTVQNDGGASIDFTAQDLVLSGTGFGVPSLFESKTLAGGGSTTTFAFSLTANSAGTVTVTGATFTATDANTAGAVPVVSNASSSVAIEAQDPASLDITGITVSRTPISTGQTVLATVTIRNDGGADVAITGQSLVLSNGALSAPSTTVVTTVTAGGGTGEFTFSVTGVSSGTTRIESATFTATDVASQLPAPVESNLVTGPDVVVQSVPSLKIITFESDSGTTLTVGQSVTVEVHLRNDGETGVSLSGGQILDDSGATNIASSGLSNQSLAGGAELEISATLTAVSAGVSSLTSFTVTAVSDNDGSSLEIASNLASPLALTVQEPASLELTSLLTERTRLTVGQTITATATVQNNGGATASFSAEQLVLTSSSVTVGSLSLVRSLSGGGATTSFEFILTGSGAGSSSLTSAVFTVTDGNTGDSLILAGNTASPVALTVDTDPILKIDAITPAQLRVTLGQTFGATLRLKNDGGASINLSNPSLVFSDGGLTAPSLTVNRLLGGGGVTTDFEFTVTAVSAGTTTISSATVAAADANSGGSVEIDSNSASPPAIVVDEPAVLKIVGLSAAREVISIGQSIQGTVTVRNDGGATVEFTSGLAVLSTGNVSASALNFGASSLGAGSTTTVQVTLTGVSSGPASLTSATFSATDANSLETVAVQSNLAPAVNILVQSRPSMSLETIAANPDRVTAGQSLTTTLTLRNSGAAPARLTSVALVFQGGNLIATPSTSVVDVAGGTDALVTFTVGGVGSGTSSITSAVLSGVDLNSSVPIGLTANNAAAVPVTVESPPGFKILAITADQPAISIGQSMSVTLTVGNDGGDGVNISQEQLVLIGSSLTANTLTDSVSLASGGDQAAFTFTVTGQSSGQTTIASGIFSATNAVSGLPIGLVANQASPVTLSVLGPPVLKIISLAASRSVISVGQSFTVTLQVRNDGEAAIQFSAESLTLPSELSGGSRTDSVLLPGGGAVTSFQMTVTGADSGSATISTATFSAVDVGNGNSVGVSSNLATPLSITVQTPPSLELRSLVASSTTIGEADQLTASTTVRNNGQATANFHSAGLIFSNDKLSASTLLQTLQLPGGGLEATFDFTVSAVSVGSSQILSAQFDVRDGNSLLPLALASNSSSAVDITVEAVPLLKILAITPDRTEITQGQSISVALSVRNDGSAAADVTGERLVVSGSALTIPDLSLNFSVPPSGGVTTVVFDVTGASTGTTTISSATLDAVNADTSDGVEIVANLATPVTVQVQSAPVLTLTSLAANPQEVSVGRPLTGKVTVANSGGASARIESLQLLLSGSTVTALVVTPSQVIPGGGTGVVDVPMLAIAAGVTQLTSAVASAVDVNNGASLESIPSTAGVFDVTVRTPPRLELVSFESERTEASVGQTFGVTAVIRNTGQDAARITSAVIVVQGPGLSLPAFSGPLSVAPSNGTTRVQLLASVASAGPVTLTSVVLDSVSAVDGSTVPLAANLASSVTLDLSVPPSLRLAALETPRTTVTVGQHFSVMARVEHREGAPVRLQEARLIFNTSRLMITAAPLSGTIRSGAATAVVTFTALARGSAGRTLITSAGFSAFDDNTGSPAPLLQNLAGALAIDIQTPPLLELREFRTERLFPNTDQSFRVTATVKNAGMATAVVTSAQLVSSGASLLTTPPALEFRIEGLSTGEITFQVQPESEGRIEITSLALAGTDANSQAAVGLTRNLASTLVLEASIAPNLEVVQFTVPSGVVTLGDTVPVQLTLRNTGTEIARVQAVTLGYSPTLVEVSPLQAPLDVRGAGAPSTLISLQARTVASGTVSFNNVTLTLADRERPTTSSIRFDLLPAVTMQVLPPNRPPTARIAGPAQVWITDGVTGRVSLDGTGSTDPNGDPLTYLWSILSGTGAGVLKPVDGRTEISFVAPAQVQVRLRVRDDRLATGSATSTLDVLPNSSPSVEISTDRVRVLRGRTVSLTAVSTDGDGDTLAHDWRVISGPALSLTTSGTSVSFAPAVTGTVHLSLTASDGKGGISTDLVRVDVSELQSWTVRLVRGFNLVSPPIRLLDDAAAPLTARGLLRAVSAVFLVYSGAGPDGRSRFNTLFPQAGHDAALTRGSAQILFSRRTADITLSGDAWPPGLPVRRFLPGIHLIGVAVGGGGPADSEDLRGIIGGSYVGRVVEEGSGRGVFRHYVPGLTPAFTLETGRGYLLNSPITQDVVIPGP